jgi:hypothetical protein
MNRLTKDPALAEDTLAGGKCNPGTIHALPASVNPCHYGVSIDNFNMGV